MTTPADANGPGRSNDDVDALFTELTSSLPDLASIDVPTGGDCMEVVEIAIPCPDRTEESLRLQLEVPAELAPMVRAEFSPDRIADMTQAINALAHAVGSTEAVNVLAGRPRLQDAILALVATGFAAAAVAFDFGEDSGDPTALAFFLVAVVGVGLVARRRSPVAVLGLVVVARLTMTWDTGNDVALIPAAMIALYTVTRTGDRRSSLIVAIGAATVMMFSVAGFNREEFLPELASEAALMLLPVAVGDAARSRADRIRDLIDTEAEARVQAERIRIARDLHDIVAHGLSTIAIQSGVAAHLLDRDPNQAKQSLEIINATGRHALEELRAMVGVLRSTDDDTPLRPTPADPNDLSDVLAGAANAGLAVTTDLDGQFPRNVGDACVVAVHRIIQEALTNVARHAGAVPVELSIHHRSDGVHLQILNEPGRSAGAAVASTGVGIIGMTERAETLGGRLRAHPTDDGGFQVDATIPYVRPSSVGESP